MEAYFDEKKKRWIFPGESADDAAAAAPSAPPTAAELSRAASPPAPTLGSAPPPATPGLDANDPLAALMAPPKSSVSSVRRHAGVAGQGGGLSGPPTGGLAWGDGGPPRVGAGATRSPFPPPGKQFTVFAPKAPVEASSPLDKAQPSPG